MQTTKTYKMSNSTNNRTFLNRIDTKTSTEILNNIAANYGVADFVILSELYDQDAQCILEYVTVNRPAVHLLYKKTMR